MGKRGPKPRYATPEDFNRAVEDYFSRCEDDGIFPDYAGLRVFLHLSQDRIDQLCKADYTGEDSKKYSEILNRARDRRESWLARTATSPADLRSAAPPRSSGRARRIPPPSDSTRQSPGLPSGPMPTTAIRPQRSHWHCTYAFRILKLLSIWECPGRSPDTPFACPIWTRFFYLILCIFS